MPPPSVPTLEGYKIYLPGSLAVFERYVRKKPLPELLYHYTDAAAAASIVRSGAMWATHVRYMTDETELVYATGVIDAVVEREAAALKALSRQWLAEFRGAAAQSFAATGTFASSFCFEGNLPNQWREYGKVDGVVLGFDAAALSRLDDATIMAVEYDPDAQRAGVRETIQIHLNAFAPPDHQLRTINALRALAPPFPTAPRSPRSTPAARWRYRSAPAPDRRSRAGRARPGPR